jgi:hypothetical protein
MSLLGWGVVMFGAWVALAGDGAHKIDPALCSSHARAPDYGAFASL